MHSAMINYSTSFAAVFTTYYLPLLAAFLTIPYTPCGNAAPIQIPDLTRCHVAVDNSVVGPPTSLRFNCCLSATSSSPVDFTFAAYTTAASNSSSSRKLRIRYPAHKVSQAYIAKYNLAYARMRALPPDDPRSLEGQARIHCAFCNGAYTQGGGPYSDVPLQVHFSWLFYPWHRWYLFFHERILGSLIDDPSFALVFWNWDDQRHGGNVMPAMFAYNETNVSSAPALFDPNRNPAHLPPTIVRLSPLDDSTNNSQVINQNLNSMYQVVVTARTAELFMGGAYRMGTNSRNATVVDAPLAGSLEAGPHNGIHYWTGNPSLPLAQDMGTFSTASRDPIFYAHHSNLDRLWHQWRHAMPGGQRADHTDPDFLDAEFLFYDEAARMVKVKVRDALSMEKLGYKYKSVRKSDRLWMRYKPNAVTNGSVVALAEASLAGVLEVGPAAAAAAAATEKYSNGSSTIGPSDIRVAPPGTLVAIVRRPPKSSRRSKGRVYEVLVIQGVRVQQQQQGSSWSEFVQLLVYVNMLPVEGTPTSSAEYVGTYNFVPGMGALRSSDHHPDLAGAGLINIQFEIGDNLKRIGIGEDEPRVLVSLVAKSASTSTTAAAAHDPPEVSIQGLLIRYVTLRPS